MSGTSKEEESGEGQQKVKVKREESNAQDRGGAIMSLINKIKVINKVKIKSKIRVKPQCWVAESFIFRRLG